MPFNKKKKEDRPIKKAPATINNYLNNKPTMARSINIQPVKAKRREVEEVKQVVNGKVADDKLIHKPKQNEGQSYFPIINGGKDGVSGVSKGRKRRSKNTKK